MPDSITDATEHAILEDLLNPTKTVEDVVKIYRDVCDEVMIHEVGTEAEIDWDLRARLQELLIKKEQLDALVVEIQSRFFEKVKRDDEGEYDRPVRRYRPYLRPRRII